MANWNCEYCSKYCMKDGLMDIKCCPKEKIQLEAKEMQLFLEQRPEDDANILVGRLTEINAYIARSGYLLANAKSIQDNTMANVFSAKMDVINSMSATMANKFMQSQCADINAVCNLLERQNKAFVHQSDNIRTQISFAKQDIALQRKGY